MKTKAVDAKVDVPLDYESALERVMSLADFERSTHSPGHSSFHLERMGLLLEYLGDPHLAAPAAHIAGTDGKGSTAAMVTSILTAAGYRAGLYTSPHLHSLVERIRVGGEPISRTGLAALVDRAWPAVEWVAGNGPYGEPSTFDFLTALAFVHFRDVGVDFQVIEVGLGGRLDATNVVRPSVCAITRINVDHAATLGGTLEKIAAEKAGIIKPGAPVVMASQGPEAAGVIRRAAQERGAPLIDVRREMRWRPGAAGAWGQTLRVDGLSRSYDLKLPLAGGHQQDNAATAVAVAETMAERGARIGAADIVAGLRDVRWPGRLQLLSYRGRTVLADGAHNPSAAKCLAESVRAHYEYNRVILVVGGLSGHSMGGMLDQLAALDPSAAVAVRSRHPRSVPSADVAQAMRGRGIRAAEHSESVSAGLARAAAAAAKDDLVLAAGSLSVVAEVIEEIEGITPELYPGLRPAAPSKVS